MVETQIYDIISNSVVTVPGVISFANYLAKSTDDLRTDDITKAVEITVNEKTYRVKIHVILINGVNIRDVISEIQIRAKYELEKLSQFVRNYIVDVAVDDLIVM